VEQNVINDIHGGIIISCQAVLGDPTFGPSFMAAFAEAASIGGAVGIRANSAEDVKAIDAAVELPIIGIWKRPCNDPNKYIITPSVEDAAQLVESGADIIAADVADRPRPGRIDVKTLIQRIKSELNVPFMADCWTLDQALRAQDAGADIAATTLALPIHTSEYEPNLDFLNDLVSNLDIPVIAEGRYWDPEDVETAFELGAWAVVIGSAVTRPWMITERFVLSSLREKNRIEDEKRV